MKGRFFIVLIVTVILAGCKSDPLDIDISGIETPPIPLQRLDQDVFSINPQNIPEKTKELTQKYGPFYQHYMMNHLKLGNLQDSVFTSNLISFLNDRDIKGSYARVKNTYPNQKLESMLPELNDCIKRFKYHFPSRPLPKKLITCISGWNYAFTYTDSALVVALDMYLGDTTVYYQMLQLPQYRTRTMNEHNILPDLLRGWIITEFDNENPVNTLLYHTIFYGKIHYAVNAMNPKMHDSLLMAYTGKQMDYCNTYEKKLWGYFAEKNRLYENNLRTIQELTVDGPFTGAISKECPPRIAMWVGLQIIRSYMENNKNITLEQLMNDNDAQKILNKSKYRP